ncbi:hypothetical protein JXA48_00460 [Candidatus Woesearchaeota archaeon]|nr:hypothetical protein [Candidatus Woesearchaeota archaeon]
MAKTVEISMDSIKKGWDDFQTKANKFLEDAQVWMKDYFSRIDTYGMLAVGTIVLGFILFIVGIIVM